MGIPGSFIEIAQETVESKILSKIFIKAACPGKRDFPLQNYVFLKNMC
jgi:hypothetical protein